MCGTHFLDSPDRVIAKAWADEAFKLALLANPREALKSQGIDLPEGVTLRVMENSDNVIHLVLPPAPDLALVEECLDPSAGAEACGACRCGACRCGCGCRCAPINDCRCN
jgi:hypothetical protein